MRTLLLLIAALLAFAGAIHAQIAAPRLNPIAIESTITSSFLSPSPFNPAVLPWDGPTRIGGALAGAEVDDRSTTPDPDADGGAIALKLRWVGKIFAFGADVLASELDIDPAVGGGTLDVSQVSIGFAGQFEEVFSVGAGVQGGEVTLPGVSVEAGLPLVGATVRLAEVIYLGLAIGDETFEDTLANQEADRTVTRFGVAYHWRDDDVGLHIEAYRQEIDAITTPFTEDEEESDGFTLEVVFANILIGFESFTTDFTDPSTGFQGEAEKTTISVGWSPGQGLALVASATEQEELNASGITQFENNLTAVGVAWLF